MKDEIKKINLPEEIEEAFNCIDYELSVCNDELPKILDYITNLQEENERLKVENKVLKEQMVAMVQPNYVYGIELQGVGKDEN